MRRGKFERAKSLMERLRPMTRSLIAIVLCMALPISVLAAAEFDLANGSVTVGDIYAQQGNSGDVEHGGSVIITQSNSDVATSNTVTVTTTQNDVTVTLDDVNISSNNSAGNGMNGSAAGNINWEEDLKSSVTIDLKNIQKAVQKAYENAR